MKRPEVYKPLLIIFFLNVGQQFNGLNVLRVYIVQIFDYIFKEDSKTDASNAPETFNESNFPLRFIPSMKWTNTCSNES